MSLSTLRTLQVPLPNGQTVPLSQIASVDYGQEYPIVWRRDRRPTVTVQADVVPGMQAATVVQALAPKIEALNASLPYGYRIDVGGTVEESGKAQSVGRGRRAADAGPDAHGADDPAAELQPPVPGAERGAARSHRRRRRAADRRQAAGLRGAPGRARADRHDRAQFGDPDRPDRAREGAWTRCLGCRHRGHHAPLPPDPADRGGGDPRHDPDRADHLLGADGLRHHGRPGGRDRAHPRLPAGALRDLVPRQSGRGSCTHRNRRQHVSRCRCHPESGFRPPGRPDRRRRLPRRRRLQPALRGTHPAGGQRGHQAGDDLCRFPG